MAELKQENLVGKKLRILREIHNYTQEYVAEQLNLKQKAYSNLETGEVSINLEKCDQLAKLYKMTPVDLLAYLHSTEKFIIQHNTGNKGNTTAGNSVTQGEINIHNHGLAEKEKALYEKELTLLKTQIHLLEQETNLLKQQNKILEEQLNHLYKKN